MRKIGYDSWGVLVFVVVLAVALIAVGTSYPPTAMVDDASAVRPTLAPITPVVPPIGLFPTILLSVLSASLAALGTGLAGLWLQQRGLNLRRHAIRAALAAELHEIAQQLYDPVGAVGIKAGKRATARDISENINFGELHKKLHGARLIDPPMYESLRPELGNLLSKHVVRTVRFHLALARHNKLIHEIQHGDIGLPRAPTVPTEYFNSRHLLFLRAAVLEYRLDSRDLRRRIAYSRRGIVSFRRILRGRWPR